MTCAHLEQMKHDLDIALFQAVVEASSFSGAARMLGLTHSAVSKRITQLEERLGAQLILRSTRQLRLTEAGQFYAAETRDILTRLDALETEISNASRQLRGRIKITSSNALGRIYVVPAILDFMSTHPEIEIDLTLTDAVVDIVREGFDLAIRSAVLPNSSLIARKLMTNRRVICASPDYLARHGMPAIPQDLGQHKCLYLNMPGAFNTWGLLWEGESRHRLGVGLICNSLETLHVACREGHGIAWLPMFLVAADIKSGLLVPLLDSYRDPKSDSAIWIVRPNAELVPNRLRTFTRFIVERFRKVVLTNDFDDPDHSGESR